MSADLVMDMKLDRHEQEICRLREGLETVRCEHERLGCEFNDLLAAVAHYSPIPLRWIAQKIGDQGMAMGPAPVDAVKRPDATNTRRSTNSSPNR